MAIDGVRWQEVFQGVDPAVERRFGPAGVRARDPQELLPNLYRLAHADGILIGDDSDPMFASSPSTVSLPGYSEIFSGRTPTCDNNECPATGDPTLLDNWVENRRADRLMLISSWSRIPRVAARDTSRIMVSAGRTDLTRPEFIYEDDELCSQFYRGNRSDPWPGTDSYRPDRYTSSIALRVLTVQQPNFLFVGLGDTDEFAHRGDYASYVGSLRRADVTIGLVSDWLTSQRAQGRRAMLIVTADHGRSAAFQHHGGTPEAARVWALLSGFGPLRHRNSIARTRLADLAPTIREQFNLPKDDDNRAGESLLAGLQRHL
jgi:hypothetical protein